MTPKAKPRTEKGSAASARGLQRNEPSVAAEEPRPWHTDEDAEGWRVRFRGKDVAAAGAAPRKVRQSVLIELDDDEVAWLDRRAAENGLTLAGAVKQLITYARQGEA